MAARLGRHRHQLPGSHCTPACAIGASPVANTKCTTHLSFLLLHSLTLRVRDRLTRRDHISVTGSAGRRLRVPATRRSPVSSRPIQTHLAAPAAGRCRRRHDVDAISFPLSAARCAPRLRGGNYTSFRDYVGAGGVRCSNEQLSHRQVIWPDASDAEDPVARPIRGRNSGGSTCQCTPQTALREGTSKIVFLLSRRPKRPCCSRERLSHRQVV